MLIIIGEILGAFCKFNTGNHVGRLIGGNQVRNPLVGTPNQRISDDDLWFQGVWSRISSSHIPGV